jgi:molecular chaperone GrpE (heat shock protein)
MRAGKEFLKDKFIEFQRTIAELNHARAEDRNMFQEKEKALCLGLLDILDAFENIDETIEAKKNEFDKTTRMLSKNIRSIHKKLIRLMKSGGVVKMEFPENKARMDYCKIVDTRKKPEMGNEAIVAVVKNGYVNKQDGAVVRKAEVITVLNE